MSEYRVTRFGIKNITENFWYDGVVIGNTYFYPSIKGKILCFNNDLVSYETPPKQ